MCKLSFSHFFIFVISCCLFISCSKSSDQREFEKRALSTPENITEMTADGNHVENRNDPDDWRIGPMFQGLIEIQAPAYPNPVSLNTPLRIDLEVKGIESINGLEIYVFRNTGNIEGPIFVPNQSPLPPGIMTITLDPAQFTQAASGGQASDLYRILIYDNQQNLITYGDVQVI